MTSEKFKFYAASYVFLLKDSSVLLQRRAHTGWRDGWYSVPAGHIESKETVAQAIIREAREEIGIKLDEKDLRLSHVMHRLSGEREYFDFFYVAEKWTGEITNTEPEKHDDLSWFPTDKLPENTVPYIRRAIKKV